MIASDTTLMKASDNDAKARRIATGNGSSNSAAKIVIKHTNYIRPIIMR
jgi:hypothetical protein